MAHYIGNVLSNLGPLINLESNQSSENLQNIVRAVSHHGFSGLKNPDALNSVLAQINNCWNSSRKRLDCLLTLQSILNTCSDEVFCNNCQSWFQLLLQTLQSYGTARQHAITLQLLTIIIQRVTAFPELDRDYGTTKIKTLLPVLLSMCSKSPEEAAAAVQCVMSCIRFFPGPTSLFKPKIEAVLTERLDSASPPTVYIRCYALLARCSTGGNQGEKHRQGWTTLHEKLMASLNKILTQLYEVFESGEEAGIEEIFVQPVPDTQPEQTLRLVHRFTVLSSCLEALFREPFGTYVQFDMEEMLHFVCRVLAVQMDMLGVALTGWIPQLQASVFQRYEKRKVVNKVSADHLLLLTYLPALHMSALDVLSQVMVCTKRLLVPYSDMIHRLCIQCLASTCSQQSTASTNKPFRQLRHKVYQTLTRWLEVAGPACGLLGTGQTSRLGDLLSHLFLDTAVLQQEALELGEPGSHSQSEGPPAHKKRKKKGKKNNYQELSSSTHLVWLAHHGTDTTLVALKVLHLIVQTIGSRLPNAELDMIQSHLMGLVQEVQDSPLPPYSSMACRQMLYEVLTSVACQPFPNIHFLHSAIACLQRGASCDPDFAVSVKCQEAVNRCRTIIHPMVPSYMAPRIHPAPPVNPAHHPISNEHLTTITNNNSLLASPKLNSVDSVPVLTPAKFQHAPSLSLKSLALPVSQPETSKGEPHRTTSASKGTAPDPQTSPALSAGGGTKRHTPANTSIGKRRRGQSESGDESVGDDSDNGGDSDDGDDSGDGDESSNEGVGGGEEEAGRKEEVGKDSPGEEEEPMAVVEERKAGLEEGEGCSHEENVQDSALSSMLASFNACEAEGSASDVSD